MNIANWFAILSNIFSYTTTPKLEVANSSTVVAIGRPIKHLSGNIYSALESVTKDEGTSIPINLSYEEERFLKRKERGFLIKFAGAMMYLFLAVIGIVGNSMVIIAVLVEPSLQVKNHLSNMPVLGLAITDWLTMVVVAIPSVICEFFLEYPFGPWICLLWGFFNGGGTVATIEHLVVISAERLIAVTWPLHYPQIVTYKRMIWAHVYIVANAAWFPSMWAIYGWEFDYDAGLCDFAWDSHGPEKPGALLYGFWSGFYHLARPSAIILACNLGIIYASRKGKKEAKKSGEKKSDEAKANAKILKAMMICIVAFFVMLFPLGIVRLKKIFGGGKPGVIPGWIVLMTVYFQFLSSCINPFIYGFFRKDFRDAFKKMFKKLKGNLGKLGK